MSDAEQVEAKPTVQSVVASLNLLSMHGVRALLVEKGIRGRRRITLDCPIANYVHSETGVGVQVGATYLNELDAFNDHRRHDLSKSVSDFIMAFDGGNFNDLLAS